ncbi:MAG: DUF1273 domain-containing protein [Clostridia bacterium]|jgi:uncharacterized phage-like protein YoqJ|nr:DUF1273 domain-containing protein [Clostridia bacterium]
MYDNVCCFIGNRSLPINKIQNIIINLDQEVENCIAAGVTDFICGGALGFDQIAASMIVAKKEMGKDIRLVFVLPCKNQDRLWSKQQKILYRNLLSEADEVIYITEKYNMLCIKRRNIYMVNHSAYCICALLKEESRTSRTSKIVCYARKNGLKIINIAK